MTFPLSRPRIRPGAVPIRRSQNAFACGARTGVFRTRRFTDRDASSTAGGREHRIAIMHDKLVRVFACQHAAELLHGPLGGRMVSDIPMQHPTGADVQHQGSHVCPGQVPIHVRRGSPQHRTNLTAEVAFDFQDEPANLAGFIVRA